MLFSIEESVLSVLVQQGSLMLDYSQAKVVRVYFEAV